MSLAEKIREQRKITVKVGHITFTGVRATTEEYSKYATMQMMDAEVARRHITDGTGLKESDFIDGGEKTEIAFNKSDFDLVVGDKPEWYGLIAKAVLTDAINRINERVENEKK